MKVGTLTFPNSPSHGASLQMYALWKVLSDLGCEAEVINYTADIVNHRRIKSVPLSFKSKLKSGEIDKTTKPHKAQIGTYIVDINGRTKPNKLNEDIFYFTAYDDGSARRQ